MRCTDRFARTALGLATVSVLSYATGCKKSTPETAPIPEVSTGTVAPSVSGALSAAAPLLNSLTTAVPGLSQQQAALSAGSLFGLAKSKMPADQYSQLTTAVPGAEALHNEAVKQGLPMNLSGVSGVTSFLGKYGVSPQMLAQVTPVIGDAIKKVNPDLATAFLAAVM